ncbi:FAD/FMN-containing dehydrogenase [Fodinibius salinus]|uniref:FAD/FMN-containing dehydrogenase n=1 Tax=Fodinibius salinus TaxID=860790 RepID=A0A5D3YKP7_9BACT|nr:FAD-binding and (Fe-S)-binding domain-containing protein [Fodinibius salinus]TYP94010.1 FAD/FMN-containing dehydrogenase [Fodinibius salinus]
MDNTDVSPKIHTDDQTRRLYANDASSYEELPKGVAFPSSTQDIVAIVKQAQKEGESITPRGAGTSLAGQTTGEGIVIDVGRHMNSIQQINSEQQWAQVQPGVIRDSLNRETDQYNLEFGPDTATTNRCMLGGMIGNNSCGIFSIKHKTTREHILEIDAVLSDGSRATFKPLTQQELAKKQKLDTLEGYIYREIISLIRENRDQILEHYPHPDIIRRNTGYALDRLCEMQPFVPDGRKFNMAELLCGSEGTLAMTTSAKVNLVPQDPESVIVVPHFSSIRKALEATSEVVKMDPAAAELVDHIILNATKDNIEQRKNRFFLDGEPHCILIIQFDGNDQQKLIRKAQKMARHLQEQSLSNSAPIITDDKKKERVWNLRKAGLGLLMGLGSEGRTPSFCEDTAVRVSDLPDYIDDFQQILDRHDTNCVFYAHASVGELHLRPQIDLQQPEGIQKMKTMAGEIAELVCSYCGSLSGEHGDGRARAPYIEKVLGSEMMPLLKRVKQIWDTHGIFNYGKITSPKPLEEDLRYSPSYQKPEIDTQFNWRKEDSFGNALELCNGAGVCRKLSDSGGTMCPSYMATKEEKDSTRGRANLFRQLFSGKQQEAFQSEELKDALDLCLSCKACKSECPANVDMARMKAEFTQGWHNKHGISLGERFFAQAAKLYPLANLFPNLSNWIIKQPVVKELLQQFLGIDKRRNLPQFAEETFMDWFNTRPTTNPAAGEEVVLLIDIFTNYHEPHIGKAAVQFLEFYGYKVTVPDFHEVGRPQISKGMLTHAKNILNQNLPKLTSFADRGLPIIGLEPSEILTLRDEYIDLCDDDQLEQAQFVADHSFTFEEFAAEILNKNNQPSSSPKKEKVYIHGHCHTKSLIGNSAIKKLLTRAGFQPIVLDTGCCGMAGSFGYEEDHYDVSMDIGKLRLFPALHNLPEDTTICAPGFSCRHQIMDGTGRTASHPAEILMD